MLFGELGITSGELAEQFVSGVLKLMGADTKPPCSGGSRPAWNAAVKTVLEELGKRHGYDQTYAWLVDLVWWSTKPERMGLVVESEMDKSAGAIEDDFEKLSVFKCPVKLMVCSSDPVNIKGVAERCLVKLAQHVKDEEYLLIGFTASGPRCFSFRVPTNGALEEVAFSELQFSMSALAGN